jgi:hypothetical protein
MVALIYTNGKILVKLDGVTAQIPVPSATAPQSNLNISQIVPAIVAFWTDSKCELSASVAGRFWTTRIIRKPISGDAPIVALQ